MRRPSPDPGGTGCSSATGTLVVVVAGIVIMVGGRVVVVGVGGRVVVVGGTVVVVAAGTAVTGAPAGGSGAAANAWPTPHAARAMRRMASWTRIRVTHIRPAPG